MINQFNEWLKKDVIRDMEHVYALMGSPISSEPEAMIDDAKVIEAWKARMVYLLAEATTWLDRASLFYLPTDTNKKELEKRIELKEKTADIREIKEKIEGLVDSIDSRISLVQSNLKYESTRPDAQVKDNRRPY